MKNSKLVWIAGGLLTLSAGLSVAPLTWSTPVVPQASPLDPGTAVVSSADAVQLALTAGKPAVAEFGANACASCREMKVVLDALRLSHGDRITVVNVDLLAQKEADYIRRYRIQLMPTQVFFDTQGREVSRHMGKLTGEEILARLQVPAQAGGPQ